MVRGKPLNNEIIDTSGDDHDLNIALRKMHDSIDGILEYQEFEPGLTITIKVLRNGDIQLTNNGRRD